MTCRRGGSALGLYNLPLPLGLLCSALEWLCRGEDGAILSFLENSCSSGVLSC
jgi:hypothetical protein